MVKCRTGSCTNPVESKGYCKSHYNSMRHDVIRKKKCTIENCKKGQRTKGLCTKHYRELDKCVQCNSGTVHMDRLCLKHYVIKNSQCSVKGCEKKEITNYTHMLCSIHYYALQNEKKRNKEKKKETSENIAPKFVSRDGIMDLVIT
jgi:hypothetical protein